MHSWKIVAKNSIVRLIFHFVIYRCLRSDVGSFADGQLTDALKNLATDSTADTKVRKKILAVLASWSRQFKDDRSAAGIAGLYRQVRPTESSRGSEVNREALVERERESEKRRKEKEEAKREAKRKAKEKRLKQEEARSKKAASQTATARRQFNFEQVCFLVALAPSQVLTCNLYRRSPRFSPPLRTRRLPQIIWLMLSWSVGHNFEASWPIHV
jgi:sRNA-binding protein